MLKRYTSKETAYIRQNWKKMSDAEIGKKIGRTPRSVERYRLKLGINRHEKNKSLPQLQAKSCSRCKKEKPFTDYHRSARNSDGFNIYCKLCAKEMEYLRYQAKLYQQNLAA